MSGVLPIHGANARTSADRSDRCRFRLESAEPARRIQPVRVRQVFQSFPAKYRYPLTCGRLCASPSHPPASFFYPSAFHRSSRARGFGPNCRQSASPWRSCAGHGVTRRHGSAMVNLIRLLTKGAKNESSKAHSSDHGSGLRDDGPFGLQSRGNHLPLGVFDGGSVTALIPLSLTICKRPPTRSAPRGRFVVRLKTKKDRQCSRKS